MSEHTNIKGRSLIQPPSGFIPSGMVPEEARWLIRMLELYFKGREIILKQISCSRLRRVADQESIELFFEDVGDEFMLDCSGSFVVSMNVFRKTGARVNADLYSREGRIDSLYIYMPDKSELDLSTPLDDVGYEVMQYARDAKADVLDAFRSSGARGAEGLKACLRDVADGAKAEVKVRLHGIACMLDGALEPGLGPLSRAIRVPLGGNGWQVL